MLLASVFAPNRRVQNLGLTPVAEQLKQWGVACAMDLQKLQEDAVEDCDFQPSVKRRSGPTLHRTHTKVPLPVLTWD